MFIFIITQNTKTKITKIDQHETVLSGSDTETENNDPPLKGETRLPKYGSQSETTIDSCL
jgi:hypothetical protein